MALGVTMLVFWRVLHGLDGGGLITLFQALVGEVVRPRNRGRMQGYLATVATSPATFGPVAGRFLTQYTDWQPVFRVHIPFAIVAVLFQLILALRPVPDRVPKFDFFGLVVLSTFVRSILLLLRQIRALPSDKVLVVVGLSALFFNSPPKRASQESDAGNGKKITNVRRMLFEATCFNSS